MYQIIKRDGKIVDFDINKIAGAMKRYTGQCRVRIIQRWI